MIAVAGLSIYAVFNGPKSYQIFTIFLKSNWRLLGLKLDGFLNSPFLYSETTFRTFYVELKYLLFR